MAKKYAIIVAGGKGLRMGTDIPKQFLILKGKPILAHTINAFYNADTSTEIILVLPEFQVDYWKELCIKYNINTPHTIALGGNERFDSVKNGLAKIKEEGLVAIHDGVRPLVSKDIITTGYSEAIKHGGVIPVVDSVDSLREVNTDSNKHVNRNLYKRVQTPQVFQTKKIIEAYNTPFSTFFTDDASVYEKKYGEIFIFNGNDRNIKITNSYDLKIAEIFLQE
jgi:2-C-methyl-D-erythritol 4-phosphate cytidylyltransferase